MLATYIAILITSDPISIPKLLDDRLELTLISHEPDIVTPTGVAVDSRGRVFVVECHTHFRPKDYPGPEKDRILLFDNIPPNGKSPPPKVFFEGTEATMNIGISPQGDLFIVTRQEVQAFRGIDRLDHATEPVPIARLETEGDYPHNGLSGFAFDRSGNLWIGLGENLGASYALVAADGSTCRGGGEGGSIFTLRTDGTKLRRVATGFWNPFHLYRDPAGFLFAVDNDPDARPPCRLLHIVDGGDYGFKFRYGRNGIHPFHAWNGELPGTLPMMAGTGEAPSGIVGIEGPGWPTDMLGQLIVTSWGDNRLERFQPQPFGTSFRSTIEPVVVGDEMFRPVGIALGKPGELYFSDWVDKSYELHRQGRLWRLRTKAGTSTANQEEIARFESGRPRESALLTQPRRLSQNSLIQTLLLARAPVDFSVRESPRPTSLRDSKRPMDRRKSNGSSCCAIKTQLDSMISFEPLFATTIRLSDWWRFSGSATKTCNRFAATSSNFSTSLFPGRAPSSNQPSLHWIFWINVGRVPTPARNLSLACSIEAISTQPSIASRFVRFP